MEKAVKNNFNQSGKSGETRDVAPDPGSSYYLSQSASLASSLNPWFAYGNWDEKQLSIFQRKQHPVFPLILLTTMCNRYYLYFIDKEPETQNRGETCPRPPLSNWTVISKMGLPDTKRQPLIFLPLSTLLFFGHLEHQFELSDPKHYAVSISLLFINKHRCHWSSLTPGGVTGFS